MRFLVTLLAAAFGTAIVAACTSSSDDTLPPNAVDCIGVSPGSGTTTSGEAGGGSCPGVCLPASNPCTDITLADGATAETCPAGYGRATMAGQICGGGGRCCVRDVVADSGVSPDDAEADAAVETGSTSDAAADATHD